MTPKSALMKPKPLSLAIALLLALFLTNGVARANPDVNAVQAQKLFDAAQLRIDETQSDDDWTFVSATVRFPDPGPGVPAAWQDLFKGLACKRLIARTRAVDCAIVSAAHDGYATSYVSVRLKGVRRSLAHAEVLHEEDLQRQLELL